MVTSHESSAGLFDPRTETAAIRIDELTLAVGPSDIPRTNYFTLFRIRSGSGEICIDAARHSFQQDDLVCCTPYQYLRFEPLIDVAADVIKFHANFLCVETFHAESGCAGELFSDPYHPPVVSFDASAARDLAELVGRMRAEQASRSLGYQEMLLAQLKILLILATRCKTKNSIATPTIASQPRHPVLGPLKALIEAHYQTWHSPADYAEQLHMPAKSLGRVVREQLGKSLTDLIRERILTHAKWQLLHTLKSVKEVSREVGFSDELYFSRMFKKATGYSPTFFREFETEIRGGSNLSMLSPPAPILDRVRSPDNSGV